MLQGTWRRAQKEINSRRIKPQYKDTSNEHNYIILTDLKDKAKHFEATHPNFIHFYLSYDAISYIDIETLEIWSAIMPKDVRPGHKFRRAIIDIAISEKDYQNKCVPALTTCEEIEFFE